MPIEPGARLDDYELLQPLGAGGMGEVWLAVDTRLGRRVALKLLPPDLTRDPVRVARFEREARAASTLSHPNVCHIYSLGRTLEGQRYIAMELVEGHTLREKLRDGRLPIRDAVEIATQIAMALVAAHASGIVHRDLKPENVMIRPDGFVKVLDFGLAKLSPLGPELIAADATQTIARTHPGTIVGTVAYMSPEQVRGQEVDQRTDVWSLAVVLYQMTAGCGPFAGQSGGDVIAGILEREPAPLARLEPDVPPELQRIVSKGLRKDREQRYQSMKDVLIDLQTLKDDLQALARSGSVAWPVPPLASRRTVHAPDPGGLSALTRRRVVLTAAALILAAACGTTVWWWLRPAHDQSPSSAATVQRGLTRLTFDPGLQTDATFSPDGRLVAYASDRMGNFDVWVQSVSGGNPVQVTKSPAQDTEPDWSPDGSTIVFRSERDGGGLFVVPALGGAEERLTSFGMHPKWSADGSEILFVSAGWSLDESGYGGTAKLYAVSRGREPREILADFLDKGYWFWIAGRPDGRISLYGRHRKLGAGFFTVPRAGGPVVVAPQPAHFPISWDVPGTVNRFQWDQAGTTLYLEATVNRLRNLWRVRVDPRTLGWLSAERLTTSGGDDGAAALSRDGSRLAFTTRSGSTRLWSFAIDAVAGRVTDTGRPVSEESADVTESDLSSDGRSVAYAVTRPGREDTELWIRELDSEQGELVARNGASPCWSPDGKQLAYLTRADGPGVLAVRQPGTPERALSRISQWAPVPVDWTRDAGAILASWSPNAASRWALTLWPISRSSADTPERIVLASERADLWQGQFSPNGRWLAFVAVRVDDPSRSTIAVATADGAPESAWTHIAPDHEWLDKPRWAPDGRTLYFISRRPTSFFNLWAVRFDPDRGRPTGQPFVLTHFDAPSRAISPNVDKTEIGISSRRVLLTIQTVSGNLWMLDNVDR